MIPVVLLGCGAWGKNLLRVLVAEPRARVVAVVDPAPAARARARELAPEAALAPSLEAAIALGARAAFVATPPATHAPIALAAMRSGLDVFVEKPLALSTPDAEACAETASRLGRVGMVGHLLRYHPAAQLLVELGRSGALGRLRLLSAARLSTAPHPGAPPLWNLGPHDLSVLFALDPSPPAELHVERLGQGAVVLHAALASGLRARIALSASHGSKERKIAIFGERGAAVFDDVLAPDAVALDLEGEPPRLLSVAPREPLALEVEHFLDRVLDRAPPRTSFEEGALVVRTLARAASRTLAAPRPAPESL